MEYTLGTLKTETKQTPDYWNTNYWSYLATSSSESLRTWGEDRERTTFWVDRAGI